MYSFSYYKEKDIEVVKAFMRSNPFAMLIGCDANSEPVATQIPLLTEERDGELFLLGHVQRKTDHHLVLEQNPSVLAVFTGPHTYISASWYTNPQTASTWNYVSVHAKGELRFLPDEELLNILSRTTAYFENNRHSPALVEKMPEEYVSKMMKAIVGFEIKVTGLDNVFKLSQNRNEESFTRIIDELEKQDEQAQSIAQMMRRKQKDLFDNTQKPLG